MGVALWLTPKPSSQIYETLTSLSTSVEPLFADSARVEPHITITSELAVNSQTDVRTVLESALAALGSDLQLEIKLKSLNLKGKNSYFKRIYFSVEKTKNFISFSTIIRELYVELPKLKNDLDAKYSAQEWSKEVFDPHLSLIYTNLSHFDNALVKTINTRVEDYLDIPSAEADFGEYNLGWSGGVLKVVNCEGPVNEWETLGSADIHIQ